MDGRTVIQHRHSVRRIALAIVCAAWATFAAASLVFGAELEPRHLGAARGQHTRANFTRQDRLALEAFLRAL